MKETKLSRRISWRIILITLLFNVFIIGAVFLFNLSVSHYESNIRAQHIIEGIDGKLTLMMKAVGMSAINNAAEFEDHLDSPETVYEAMEHELRLNTHYLGFGIGFISGYFPDQGHWFEPYVNFSDSTHIERKQIGSAKHDYFHHDWYIKGYSLERKQGYLTDPYYDDAGGKQILSTYVTPVFDRQGRKVAVFGIDLDLNWIKSSIAKEEKRVKKMRLVKSDDDDDENSFFIQILDSKGNKIAGSEDFDEETTRTILKEDSIDYQEMRVNGTTYLVSSKRLAPTDWTLVVAQHQGFVLENGYWLGGLISLFMIVSGIVMFFFTSRSIRRAVAPLHFLSKSAQEVAQGNFDTPLPTFRHQDEVAQLRDSFDTMQQSLKRYMKELKKSTAAKASLESELNVAHSIQMSMLPKTFPPFPYRKDIELYGIQTPAKAVGGDLFDFFISNEKLFFCIGDVSGKGVPASLVMAVTRTLFRNISAHTTEPSHIVDAMNAAFNDSNDNNMFVTLFVGVLDLQTGLLRYSNAGHEAPYLLTGDGELTFVQCDSNLPIGVTTSIKYSEQQVEMASGSIIFLYTDGLTEAEDAQLDLFGKQRITHVIKPFSGSPQELIERMIDAVHQFVGDTEQSDDLTMLSIKYTK